MPPVFKEPFILFHTLKRWVFDMVERVTITIKRELLKKIDSMIDGKAVKNRSHAIEQLILKSSVVDTAIILAGGKARINGKAIPKALIRIHKLPVIVHQINMLKRNSIMNIFILTDSKEATKYIDSLSTNEIKPECMLEKMPLGTAGPMKLAEDKIRGTFVLLNVDTLMEPDIKAIADFHLKHGTIGTVLLATTDRPSSFGVVRMHGSQITDFVEKPRIKEARLFNAGLCVFEPSVLKYIRGRMMIEQLFSQLAKDRQLSGFVYDGSVLDVGTQDGYEKARLWKL